MVVVSVIMSVRNGALYLNQAVRSILKQSFRNFEFIIIDDHSQDNTKNILRSFNDNRLKIIYNSRHLGLTKSLNLALAQANGDYIARMDADDISHPDRLAKQISFLKKHERIGVLGCAVRVIDHYSNTLDTIYYPGSTSRVAKVIFQKNPLRHSSVIMRTSLLKKYGYYDPLLDGAEDYDLWLRLAKHTQIVNLRKVLLDSRIHASRVSEKEANKVLLAAIRARHKAICEYGYSPLNYFYLIIPLLSMLLPKPLKKLFLKNKL